MKVSTHDSSDFSGRLKAARAALGLTQVQMAEQSGVSARGYQGYEDGRSVPGGEALSGMVRAGVNANWLLTGDGEMLLQGASGGPHQGSGSQVQYLVSEPPPAPQAPPVVDSAFLRLCLGACVMVHGEGFARETAALQVEYACDIYNLLVKQAGAQGQGIKAAVAAFTRLETRGVADQLRLLLQLGWARVYNSDDPPPGTA